MMLTTQAQIAAMEGTVGQAAHMAFPGASRPMADAAGRVVAAWGPYLAGHQEHFWAGLTTLAAVLLLLSGGYRRLERITTVLVAAVTLFTVASVVILQWTTFRITWSDLRGGFELGRPHRRASPWRSRPSGSPASGPRSWWPIRTGASRRATRGIAGARSEDAGWAHRARGWIRVMQLDAWFSMVVFTVATVAFYFLGAAVLHPQGLDPKGPEMIPTLSLHVSPAARRDAPGLARGRSRGSASCWGPGPCCSRRCTSPRRPTAG